jgi:hypothetical protein
MDFVVVQNYTGIFFRKTFIEIFCPISFIFLAYKCERVLNQI